jgi:hypothetical protein
MAGSAVEVVLAVARAHLGIGVGDELVVAGSLFDPVGEVIAPFVLGDEVAGYAPEAVGVKRRELFVEGVDREEVIPGPAL